MNQKEAECYYSRSIVEMSEIERKPYMENEIKYLSFFQMLFDLNNQELMIRINFISNSDINEFFENEKNNFMKELKK